MFTFSRYCGRAMFNAEFPPRCLMLLLIAFATMASATASTYCVDSNSSAVIALCGPVPGDCSLRGAVFNANEGPEGSTQEIRVATGSYVIPAGLNFDPAGDRDNKDFSISGGWNAACTTRTINPATTVISAANSPSDGNFEFRGDQQRIIIEGLRFEQFALFGVDDGLCAPFDICPDTAAVRLRYNMFRDGGDVEVYVGDAAQLSISNNLFANLASGSHVRVVDLAYSNAESAPDFSFNTFAGIACGGNGRPAVGLSSKWQGTTAHHNIFQSVGCSADLYLSNIAGDQPIALRNNLFNTRIGQAPLALSGNVISSNPGFVNSAGGNFHLLETAPVSASINAGLTSVQAAQFGLTFPSQDLDGPSGQRLIGQHADIGAYESSINDASVLVVNALGNSGVGTLRQALISANANPGKQVIEFNLPGACPGFIELQSPLPDIVDDVEIDGYSQPGASANTQSVGSDASICVVVSSPSATLTQYLQVPAAAPASTSLILKGLAFTGQTGFSGNANVILRLRGGSDHVIQGNAFGGVGPGATGALGEPVQGISIRDVAQNALIGGPQPEHRNSFGAMSNSAIVLFDATSGSSNGHTIQNNYIGLTATGIVASSIALNAIFASNTPNVEIFDNVIAAVPNSAAISINGASATGYKIRGNRIGVNAINIGTAAFRVDVGIKIGDGSGGHEIGSALATTQSNTIANSNGAGVWIDANAGNGTLIRPNKIFNTGVSGLGLGIDLGALGQLTNDVGDADAGPNRGQNWPVVSGSLSNANGTRQIDVMLSSSAATNYRIDVYRAPDCPGGDRGGNMTTRVATQLAVTGNQGLVNLNFPITGSGAPGYLTATATNVSTGDTSEVSVCFQESAVVDLFSSGFE